MNINKASTAPQSPLYTGKSPAAAVGFSDQLKNAAAASGKGRTVYMKTDDMLYSGGNGTGLSYYLKYADSSTDEDPTVIAKGVDENGNEFEQTIHINDIDPRNATIVEMHALEEYTGAEKRYGFTSLPLSTGNMGLYERRNFINMFEDSINNLTLLKAKKAAAYYKQSVQVYLDFMNHGSK